MFNITEPSMCTLEGYMFTILTEGSLWVYDNSHLCFKVPIFWFTFYLLIQAIIESGYRQSPNSVS